MKNTTFLSVAFLVFGVALVACKKDSPTESPLTQTNNPPATQASFPTGTFAATDAEGRWVQVYRADSTFSLTRNGTAVFSRGKYTSTGNRVELSENSSICSGLGNGTYTWSLNGSSLKFTVVADGCVSRKNTLTTNTWTKE